jgi:hypothetical protein
VVTLAVYFYFLASLFGAQWVMPATEEVKITFLFEPAFALCSNLKVIVSQEATFLGWFFL